MTPHSSTLAWKIPWTEEPGRLNFSNAFPASVELIMWFLFFILLWYIILIDFHMLNHLCIVGMNPTLSRCIISSICC